MTEKRRRHGVVGFFVFLFFQRNIYKHNQNNLPNLNKENTHPTRTKVHRSLTNFHLLMRSVLGFLYLYNFVNGEFDKIIPLCISNVCINSVK